MNWIKPKDKKPPLNEYVLVACSKFCRAGYIMALWDGKEWYIDGFGAIAEAQIDAWSKIKGYYPKFH